MNVNLQSVTDREEALAYLKGADRFANRSEHPFPNLVLLDLKLPRVNGFDVLAWVRQEQRLRRLPVIVLTSSGHEADVKRAYDLGANSFLIKPVAFEALVKLAEGIKQYWLGINQRPAI